MQVFNLGNQQNVARGLQLGVDYKEVADGHNFMHKIVNLENPFYCQRSGIIELEAMKVSNKHGNSKVFRNVKDKKTGLIWGVPIGVNNETKELQYKAFKIEDRMTFDLSIAEQAMAWAIIKNSPFVEGSPNQYGKSVYKVINKEKKAAEDNLKRTIKRKAEDMVAALVGDALTEAAVNLGVNVSANQNLDMLTAEVYRMMEINPKAFIEMMENPNRQYISILNRAMSVGIIVHDVAVGVYKYNNLPIGHNKDLAVKYLVDSPGMASSINARCDSHDSDTRRAMQMTYEVDKIDEIAMLKKQLAELQAKAEGKLSVVAEVVAEPFKDPFALTDIKEVDDMKSLRAEAKLLGVKGYALPSLSAEKLKAKITEAKLALDEKED